GGKATGLDYQDDDVSPPDHPRRLLAYFASNAPSSIIPVASQFHFLPPVNGVSGCAAINSSHARIPSLLKACKKDQVEALRTWSGRNVYHAALRCKSRCSANVRALGN